MAIYDSVPPATSLTADNLSLQVSWVVFNLVCSRSTGVGGTAERSRAKQSERFYGTLLRTYRSHRKDTSVEYSIYTSTEIKPIGCRKPVTGGSGKVHRSRHRFTPPAKCAWDTDTATVVAHIGAKHEPASRWVSVQASVLAATVLKHKIHL